eukprot:2250939-Amphidinium_carterae.1
MPSVSISWQDLYPEFASAYGTTGQPDATGRLKQRRPQWKEAMRHNCAFLQKTILNIIQRCIV